MTYGVDVSPAFVPSIQHAIYHSSIASSASASTTSILSDASSQSSQTSQSSDDTAISNANSSDLESCDSLRFLKQTRPEAASLSRPQHTQQESVPAELRQNPRRSAAGTHGRGGCPPPLVRQSERKGNFVDGLVDSATHIVEAIWPLSSAVCRSELGSKAVLPLRTFIQETLRRSRTSYSTLQVALYYLVLIKPHVPKHNFTMEQPDDGCHGRALQCGRRMFLAALILASKYLQDRNYSARAWSKISGLNTQEINQNEIAFLLAVDWKIHIADQVFQRWTDIVLKYTPPPSPPSPGGAPQPISQQAIDWKRIILGLNTELTNINDVLPAVRFSTRSSDLSPLSPRSILNTTQEGLGPQPCDRASAMGSTPTVPNATRRLAAPSLGMLPTPRLTPQASGFCTPAVSAASHILGRTNSMGLAMSQATNANAAQYLDRPRSFVSTSPQNYCPARRSSLANSISTPSSPESMVSDTSSVSSSLSSASSAPSFASATANPKLSAHPRSRITVPGGETLSQRQTVPSVWEDDERGAKLCHESYTGPVRKLNEAQWESGLERNLDLAYDPASDAARALQDLHNQYVDGEATCLSKPGSKRSRPMSMENMLQDNVRILLNNSDSAWSKNQLKSQALGAEPHVPVLRSSKRLCCSTEATNGYEAVSSYPVLTTQRPGMWHGILH